MPVMMTDTITIITPKKNKSIHPGLAVFPWIKILLDLPDFGEGLHCFLSMHFFRVFVSDGLCKFRACVGIDYAFSIVSQRIRISSVFNLQIIFPDVIIDILTVFNIGYEI